MSDEALKRYTVIGTYSYASGEVRSSVAEKADGVYVLADAAAREIARLEGELVVERNNGRILNEVARALGEHHTMTPVEAAKDLVWQREQLGARVRELEQERDLLREQYNKVLGAIDEGLVEDDATLAAASVTEMHAKIAQQ